MVDFHQAWGLLAVGKQSLWQCLGRRAGYFHKGTIVSLHSNLLVEQCLAILQVVDAMALSEIFCCGLSIRSLTKTHPGEDDVTVKW